MKHSPIRIGITLVGAVVFAATLAGCASTQPAVQPGFTDGQIAGIISTINQGAIRQAELASSRATTPGVKEFAQTMLSDHHDVADKISSTLSQIHVTALDSDAARTLSDNADQTVQALQTYQGAAFDRKFVQTEAAVHGYVHRLLQDTLIPATRNAKLRNLLQAIDQGIQKHLSIAQGLEGSIGS
ncbi:MAG: DUF4142 domain-containing protein [Thermoanaerobaculia bacterium]